MSRRDTPNRRSRRLELLRQASPSHREERDQQFTLKENVRDLGHPEENNNIGLPEEEDLETMSEKLAAEPLVFALTPAQINTVNAIDHITSDGVKACNAATAELVRKSKSVCAFCEKLNDRTSELGWDATRGDTITMPDSNGINRNLIVECDRLTFENIQDLAVTYINDDARRTKNIA